MIRNLIIPVILTFLSVATQAEPLSLDQPLPSLAIAEKGELLLENKEYGYRPWSSENSPDEVHVLQYLVGTKRGSEIFKPFTDRLRVEFNYQGYHVTTIVNLDAAMWGTTGFVISELKSSKKEFPGATMVLDEDGLGEDIWELGKKGALLVVMDKVGTVVYISRKALSDQEVAATLALVREQIES